MKFNTVTTEQFDNGVVATLEPWTDGHAVGFKVTTEPGGAVEYIYFNPSSAGDSPYVFVYCGKHGMPDKDTPTAFFPVGPKFFTDPKELG